MGIFCPEVLSSFSFYDILNLLWINSVYHQKVAPAKENPK